MKTVTDNNKRTTYRNSFYNKQAQNSHEFIDADPNKVIYNGYEIHAYSSVQFHIVKNSICIGMYAGINGAKKRIDELIEESTLSNKQKAFFHKPRTMADIMNKLFSGDAWAANKFQNLMLANDLLELDNNHCFKLKN